MAVGIGSRWVGFDDYSSLYVSATFKPDQGFRAKQVLCKLCCTYCTHSNLLTILRPGFELHYTRIKKYGFILWSESFVHFVPFSRNKILLRYGFSDVIHCETFWLSLNLHKLLSYSLSLKQFDWSPLARKTEMRNIGDIQKVRSLKIPEFWHPPLPLVRSFSFSSPLLRYLRFG